jgi:hypothetical protein
MEDEIDLAKFPVFANAKPRRSSNRAKCFCGAPGLAACDKLVDPFDCGGSEYRQRTDLVSSSKRAVKRQESVLTYSI